MDAYKRQTGKEHPMARKTLNLVWLRVPDPDAFRQVAEQIMASGEFKDPAVKTETASSGIALASVTYASGPIRYAKTVTVPCGTGTAVTSTSAMRIVAPGAIGIARPCGLELPGSGRMLSSKM